MKESLIARYIRHIQVRDSNFCSTDYLGRSAAPQIRLGQLSDDPLRP